MNEKIKRLIAETLSDYSNQLEFSGCNDWSFPNGWTHQEKVSFCKGYHDWNGDPEEFNEESLWLPDFAVADYLAHLVLEGAA